MNLLRFFTPKSDDLSWFVFGVVPHDAADQFTFTSFFILHLLIYKTNQKQKMLLRDVSQAFFQN